MLINIKVVHKGNISTSQSDLHAALSYGRWFLVQGFCNFMKNQLIQKTVNRKTEKPHTEQPLTNKN